MGSKNTHRKNPTARRTDKIGMVGDRRAGSAACSEGHNEHLDEREIRAMVLAGINPETKAMYPSIASHREALIPYWDSISSQEMAHIRAEVWHRIHSAEPSSLKFEEATARALHPTAARSMTLVPA